MSMSVSERKFIAGGIAVNCRGDGRGRMDMRNFTVETDVVAHANGSARVRLDGTDILVAVNVELEEPDPETPEEGKVTCSVECTTSASMEYEGNGATDLNQTLTRQLSQVIGLSGAIDTKEFGLIPGKQCWSLYVDAMVLGAAGNLLDAIVLAANAAIHDATIPCVSIVQGDTVDDLQVEVDGDPWKATKLPFTEFPVCVSLSKIGSCFIVDATEDEDACMATRLAVAVNESGDVCGVHKTGPGGLSPAAMQEIIKVARTVGMQLHGTLKKACHPYEEDEAMSFVSL